MRNPARVRIVELRELFLDEVETLSRAAIVVFVVTDDHPLGHAFDAGGIAG